MKVSIYTDPESLSKAAADLFMKASQQAISDLGSFHVALSGGSTPRQTYELLAAEPWKDKIYWNKIHLFWGDERCVPSDDPRNNALMARLALLDKVPVPVEQVHPILCAKGPKTAAEKYEILLHPFFKGRDFSFDFIFLGLGADGHTASLFPGTKTLSEKERWVSEVSIASQEVSRVTLTIPIINRSRLVVFLVTGQEKALILKKVLEASNPNPLLPAGLISPICGEINWMVDKAAASLLDRKLLKHIIKE